MFYIIILLALSVNSYYHKTHEFLGKYLENYIQQNYNNLYIKSKNIIYNESFSDISTWADKIKTNNIYIMKWF